MEGQNCVHHTQLCGGNIGETFNRFFIIIIIIIFRFLKFWKGLPSLLDRIGKEENQEEDMKWTL